MKFPAVFGLFIFLSLSATAETLTSMTLKDQWDKDHTLDESIELVIFSHHKKGSEWIKQTLQSLNISNLAERHWLYIADISGMPSLISRMFALPKMRDYDFPIALVRDDALVKTWPTAEDAVAVYELNKLDIKKTVQLKNKQELETFLAEKIQQ